MKAKDIMSNEIIFCTTRTTIRDVCRLMEEYECGLIPVVDSEKSLKPVGVITDRDVVCRVIAKAKDPNKELVESWMTKNITTVRPEATLEECVKVMEHEQIRRLLVVDQNRALCGVVAQADIALNLSESHISELLKRVSVPVPRKRRKAQKHGLHVVEAHV